MSRSAKHLAGDGRGTVSAIADLDSFLNGNLDDIEGLLQSTAQLGLPTRAQALFRLLHESSKKPKVSLDAERTDTLVELLQIMGDRRVPHKVSLYDEIEGVLEKRLASAAIRWLRASDHKALIAEEPLSREKLKAISFLLQRRLERFRRTGVPSPDINEQRRLMKDKADLLNQKTYLEAKLKDPLNRPGTARGRKDLEDHIQHLEKRLRESDEELKWLDPNLVEFELEKAIIYANSFSIVPLSERALEVLDAAQSEDKSNLNKISLSDLEAAYREIRSHSLPKPMAEREERIKLELEKRLEEEVSLWTGCERPLILPMSEQSRHLYLARRPYSKELAEQLAARLEKRDPSAALRLKYFEVPPYLYDAALRQGTVSSEVQVLLKEALSITPPLQLAKQWHAYSEDRLARARDDAELKVMKDLPSIAEQAIREKKLPGEEHLVRQARERTQKLSQAYLTWLEREKAAQKEKMISQALEQLAKLPARANGSRLSREEIKENFEILVQHDDEGDMRFTLQAKEALRKLQSEQWMTLGAVRFSNPERSGIRFRDGSVEVPFPGSAVAQILWLAQFGKMSGSTPRKEGGFIEYYSSGGLRDQLTVGNIAPFIFLYTNPVGFALGMGLSAADQTLRIADGDPTKKDVDLDEIIHSGMFVSLLGSLGKAAPKAAPPMRAVLGGAALGSAFDAAENGQPLTATFRAALAAHLIRNIIPPTQAAAPPGSPGGGGGGGAYGPPAPPASLPRIVAGPNSPPLSPSGSGRLSSAGGGATAVKAPPIRIAGVGPAYPALRATAPNTFGGGATQSSPNPIATGPRVGPSLGVRVSPFAEPGDYPLRLPPTARVNPFQPWTNHTSPFVEPIAGPGSTIPFPRLSGMGLLTLPYRGGEFWDPDKAAEREKKLREEIERIFKTLPKTAEELRKLLEEAFKRYGVSASEAERRAREIADRMVPLINPETEIPGEIFRQRLKELLRQHGLGWAGEAPIEIPIFIDGNDEFVRNWFQQNKHRLTPSQVQQMMMRFPGVFDTSPIVFPTRGPSKNYNDHKHLAKFIIATYWAVLGRSPSKRELEEHLSVPGSVNYGLINELWRRHDPLYIRIPNRDWGRTAQIIRETLAAWEQKESVAQRPVAKEKLPAPRATNPVDLSDMYDLMPELDRVTRALIEKFDPRAHAFIFVGRSGTLVNDYLNLLAPGATTRQVPLSGMGTMGFPTDREQRKLFDHFDDWLRPDGLGAKTLVIVDYTQQGASLSNIMTQAIVWAGLAGRNVRGAGIRYHRGLPVSGRGPIEGVDFLIDLPPGSALGEAFDGKAFKDFSPVPHWDLTNGSQRPKLDELSKADPSLTRVRYLENLRQAWELFSEGNVGDAGESSSPFSDPIPRRTFPAPLPRFPNGRVSIESFPSKYDGSQIVYVEYRDGETAIGKLSVSVKPDTGIFPSVWVSHSKNGQSALDFRRAGVGSLLYSYAFHHPLLLDQNYGTALLLDDNKEGMKEAIIRQKQLGGKESDPDFYLKALHSVHPATGRHFVPSVSLWKQQGFKAISYDPHNLKVTYTRENRLLVLGPRSTDRFRSQDSSLNHSPNGETPEQRLVRAQKLFEEFGWKQLISDTQRQAILTAHNNPDLKTKVTALKANFSRDQRAALIRNSVCGPDEAAFLRMIHENPNDDGPRLVFADWLEEQGDSIRASMIRDHIELTQMRLNGRVPWERHRALVESVRDHVREAIAAWDATGLGRRIRELGGAITGFERGMPVVRFGSESFSNNLEAIATLPITGLRYQHSGLGSIVYVIENPRFATFFRGLVRLDITGEIGPQDSRQDIILALARSPNVENLRSLDVSGLRIGNTGVAAIGASQSLRGLQELNLRNNDFHTEGLAGLLGTSSQLRDLRILDLSHNQLGLSGGNEIATSTKLGKLKELNLAATELTASGTRLIAGSSGLPELESLDLAFNFLRGTGAQDIVNSTHLPRLRSLSLSGNEIEARWLPTILDSRRMRLLLDLNLSNNNLGAAAATLFANSPNVVGLRGLFLRNTGIDDDGISLMLGSTNLRKVQQFEADASLSTQARIREWLARNRAGR